MNLLVVGGSNSLMVRGYTAQFPRLLAEKIGETIDTVNLSVGATVSLMGLEMLHRYPAASHPGIDLVVVEFCINDIPLVRGADFSFWEASYEGLIRHCLRAFPGKPVISVLLGRREEMHQPKQDQMKRGIVALSDTYRNHYTVDVDAMLRQRYPESDRFKSLYSDPAHYNAQTVEEISLFLAESIYPIVSNHNFEFEPLAEPHFSYCFDETTLVEVPTIEGRERVKFANSRMSYDASRLQAEETLQMELPGRAIAISFISSADSGTLDVTVDRRKYCIHTLMKVVSEGRFRFLLKNASFNWREARPPEGTEILDLKASVEVAPDRRLHHQYNLIPATVENPSVYIIAVLCDTTRRSETAPD